MCELLLGHIYFNPPGSLWLKEGRSKVLPSHLQALILIVKLGPPVAHGGPQPLSTHGYQTLKVWLRWPISVEYTQISKI